MHELSICTSLAAIVTEHAGGRPVRRVHVDIGHLRQVIPDTLRYSWDIVAIEPPLAGSELVVNHIPAVLHCRDCHADTTIEVAVFRCASCGSTATDVTSGQELLVRSLELTEPTTVLGA